MVKIIGLHCLNCICKLYKLCALKVQWHVDYSMTGKLLAYQNNFDHPWQEVFYSCLVWNENRRESNEEQTEGIMKCVWLF